MKRTLIEIVIAAILVVAIILLWRYCESLKDDKASAERTNATLMTEIEHYKVADSLNVTRCTALELEIDEFREYRKKDYDIISDLKAKRRELERIANMQTLTIDNLKAQARDTIIIRDSVPVPVKTIDFSGKWCDFHGEIEDGQFTGQVTHRDSLIVVESVKMTKCIVKKWRKIKELSIEVVSKNPNTIISNIEYVVIEK